MNLTQDLVILLEPIHDGKKVDGRGNERWGNLGGVVDYVELL